MKRIAITGTAGLLGPSVVEHFLEKGYEVISADRVKPAKPLTRHVTFDMTNLGECYGILEGADAVVHLAAIPTAYIFPNEVTFHNNVMGTYNMLEASGALGIGKAVVASSECAYGICNSRKGLIPAYVPIDEDHPLLPEDSYGLGKICGEQIAEAMHRRYGMQIISFRIGNVITGEKYLEFPGFINDAHQRGFIMWNYIDARDVAAACRLAVEKDDLGCDVMNLAADDNCTTIKSRDLMKIIYPSVTDFRSPIDEYQTLYSNAKAKRILGWAPVHKWRDNVDV